MRGRSPVHARARSRTTRLAQLLTLTAFAIGQPLLDVMGRSPEYFLFRRLGAGEILALVALIVLAPPLVLWLVELAAGVLGERTARRLHTLFVAVLVAIVAVEVGKHLDVLSGAPLALLAAAVGLVAALALPRSEPLRSLLGIAAPAPLVFALLFVFTTPAGDLARGGGGEHTTPRAGIERTPPIVFVFLDEFPERALLDERGRIDARLYPNFARLADVTTWYPNATGVSGFTPYAAPAMLSGRFPEKRLAPSFAQYPDTLYALLEGTYRTRAYESITQLCPPRMCSSVPAGRATGLRRAVRDTLELALDIVSPSDAAEDPTEQFREETVPTRDGKQPKDRADVSFRIAEASRNQPERFRSFMEGLRPSAEPQLHFLHLLLPHGPWRYLPSGRVYPPAANSFIPPPEGHPKTGRLSPDPLLSLVGRQRLLLQLAYTDRLLGAMLDRLEATGMLDESLLIVTADHGSGLAPDVHSRQLDARNPLDIAWVPLFVKAPGERGGRVDRRNAMQVDLLPTIAEVLGAEVPWRVDGRSLLGAPRPTGDKEWYDDPGKAKRFVDRDWLPRVARGFGPDTIQPARGRAGMFAVGPLGRMVGRPLRGMRQGPPVAAVAERAPEVSFDEVDPGSGTVPAMVWGTLDRPLGPSSRWLAVVANGVVAGAAAAVEGGDGQWRFQGVLDDSRLRAGRNRVELFTSEGGVLRRVRWTDD